MGVIVNDSTSTGSANTIRLTSLTYPDGRVISFGYGASDAMADALSRVAAISDGDNALNLDQFHTASYLRSMTLL